MVLVAGQLDPFPMGWFCVAMSEEVPRGGVLGRTFGGREVVVFRGHSGRVSVLNAYCPHLGAHMAKGGRVEGDTLRCPFHGFRFDHDGRCVSTEYGQKAPPTARTTPWEVCEQNGLILVWIGVGAPTFSVPPLDDTNWTPPIHKLLRLNSHPQETTENSVDLGHLAAVHGYRNVSQTGEPEARGAYLGLRYAMTRRNPFFGGLGSITTDFDVHVHGLGHSLVDIRPRKAAGMHLRLFVLPSPCDGKGVELRIAVSVERTFPVPFGLAERVVGRIGLMSINHDVKQDFDIWQNKVWVARPAIAKGDGPISLYRAWCRQFYPSPPPVAQDIAIA